MVSPPCYPGSVARLLVICDVHLTFSKPPLQITPLTPREPGPSISISLPDKRRSRASSSSPSLLASLVLETRTESGATRDDSYRYRPSVCPRLLNTSNHLQFGGRHDIDRRSTASFASPRPIRPPPVSFDLRFLSFTKQHPCAVLEKSIGSPSVLRGQSQGGPARYRIFVTTGGNPTNNRTRLHELPSTTRLSFPHHRYGRPQ